MMFNPSRRRTVDRPANPQPCPDRFAQEFLARDGVAKLLNIQLEAIQPGCATVSMKIRPDMISGVGLCHGGITFTLANTALALACNSRNRKTLNLSTTIQFTEPVQQGDTLTATAEALRTTGKVGVYDVHVLNQQGTCVALFRANTYATAQVLFPEVENTSSRAPVGGDLPPGGQ